MYALSGSVCFVAGRGKQMAGWVPSYKNSNTHTHTHTHKGREREMMGAWSEPPITLPFDSPSTPSHTYMQTHTDSQIFSSWLFLFASFRFLNSRYLYLLNRSVLVSCSSSDRFLHCMQKVQPDSFKWDYRAVMQRRMKTHQDKNCKGVQLLPQAAPFCKVLWWLISAVYLLNIVTKVNKILSRHHKPQFTVEASHLLSKSWIC